MLSPQKHRKYACAKRDEPIASAVANLLHDLTAARSQRELMENVTRTARYLLHADGVTFVMREGDHCYYAEEDAIKPLWKGKRFPLQTCISGRCIEKHQQVIARDTNRRALHNVCGQKFIRSLAAVPIHYSQPNACITSYWFASRKVTRREIYLMKVVANTASISMLNITCNDRLKESLVVRQETVHRMKNNFSVVASLARQTFRFSENMAIFKERFLARLQSLAASQEILSEAVEHGVNLTALIQSQVILGEGEHRIICRGPDVFLAADTGLEVGLVLHELGTNARKYGALSSETGQITIDWQIVRRDGPLSVRMIWVEQKGPPVTKPVNTGFGSKLLEYALRKAGGQISVNYETSGFVCHMLIPIERHNSSKSIEK